MDTNGENDRFFIEGGSPIWSPDGSRIAFIRQGEPQGSQIFVKIMGIAGEATQITRIDGSPSNIQWSPDGKYFSFTMLVPENKQWPVKMPEKPRGAEWTPAPKIIEDLVYRRDRVGFLEEGYTQIFVVPASGGTARQVTTGDWDQGRSGYSWTKDGKEILFSSLRIPEAEYQYRESEIYAVNVQTGEVRTLTDRKGPDYSPVVSPDNRLVVYQGYDWTDDAYINSKLYVMNLDGSNVRLLTGSFDKNMTNIQWADDNSGVYATVREEGTGNLYFIPCFLSRLRTVTDGLAPFFSQ